MVPLSLHRGISRLPACPQLKARPSHASCPTHARVPVHRRRCNVHRRGGHVGGSHLHLHRHRHLHLHAGEADTNSMHVAWHARRPRGGLGKGHRQGEVEARSASSHPYPSPRPRPCPSTPSPCVLIAPKEVGHDGRRRASRRGVAVLLRRPHRHLALPQPLPLPRGRSEVERRNAADAVGERAGDALRSERGRRWRGPVHDGIRRLAVHGGLQEARLQNVQRRRPGRCDGRNYRGR